MSHFPEVITLLSSDEESPSTEDVTPLSAKNAIPIKLKESARKSINTRKDNAAMKSSGSTKQSSSKSNSSLKVINISSVPHGISHLNHINSPTVNAFAKKLPQTARKSIYLSQSPQNILSNNSNSNNVPSKQTHDTKTIILNDKQLLNSNVHCKPVEKHNSMDDKSKGRLIVSKSLINNKDATTSLNRPKKEIPFADKLKERGISISSNTKSDKNIFSVATTKNDNKNVEILTMNPQVNGLCKNIKENKETLSSHTISNKNIHNPTKFDKDVSLSWSKKRKLTTNVESMPVSQFKPDLTRKLPTNSGSKLESQSKGEVCIGRKLTKNNESRPVGKSEMSTSIDINTLNKVAPLSSNLNSKTSVNGNRLSSPEHIIIVKSDGTAYKTKSSDLDKKLTSLDTDVICLDPSSSEKNKSVNAGSSTNVLNAKNETASDISTKCASSANFQDDGSLDIIDLLTSEPIPASEKVQQYLSNNSAMSERTGRQTKEVTSPKLSLKRKRQEEGEILSMAKKGLFSNERKKESPEKQKDGNVTKHYVPSHKEDPTSAADKENKSITVNSSLGERSDLQDAMQDLPGPSHETSSVESNTQKFEMFMDFCMKSSVLKWEEKSKVRSIFSKSMLKASDQFVSSLEFSNLIDTMFSRIREHPGKINSLLMDFRKQLRENRTKHHQTEIEPPSQNKNIKDVSSACSKNDDSVVPKHNFKKQEATMEMPSQSSSSKKTEQNFKIDSNVKSEKPSFFPANLKLSTEEAQRKLEKKISKLKNHMRKLDNKLKELQAKELSLDDLDDENSTYVEEDRYKKRLLESYKLLCKMEGAKWKSGLKFEMERRYSFNGTRYQEINRAVENFINKRKKVEKFPSYVDIFNLVKRTNESLILGIKESEYSRLARDIFEEAGNELKRRRQKDDEENFGCYLTDNVKLEEDPAERDEELNLKLTNSVIQGELKLKELIEKYAAKQENDADGGSEQDEANADDGSERDEANADDGSGQDDTDGKSEQDKANAENNVLFDPKCNENDDDLPSTNPATPTTGVPDEPTSPLNSFQKREINVVIVGSDSDVSTDPGPEKNNFNTVSAPAVDSDSSCDLPPLNFP